MTRDWINAQEGQIAYATYRPEGMVTSQTSQRGVVYQGTFYTVKVGGDHKNDPKVYLTPISETAMIDIRRIEEHERGDLETSLLRCLSSHPKTLEGEVLVLGTTVPLEVKKL